MNGENRTMTMDRIRAALVGLLIAAAGVLSGAVQAGTITYYHNDLTGSPVVATNAAGQVIWRESYRPYGERTVNSAAALDNKVWFTSRRQDPETGLVYMGARYYDPVVGRFVSTDPVGFDEKNLHSFNRYAYANNNPYKYVDPDGRWGFLINVAQRLATFLLTRGPQASVAAAEIGAGEALGAGSVAAGAVAAQRAAAKAAALAGDEGGMLYRAGGSSPSNLKTRPGEDAVSFRDSLSNPIESKERPVMRPGEQYIGVESSKLPPGSVMRDNNRRDTFRSRLVRPRSRTQSSKRASFQRSNRPMAEEWKRDERNQIGKHLPRLREVIENESVLIVEHRFYRGARAPQRLIFDDFDRLETYINVEASPGDAFYVWKFEETCTSEGAFISGKVPDDEGRVPMGGAY